MYAKKGSLWDRGSRVMCTDTTRSIRAEPIDGPQPLLERLPETSEARGSFRGPHIRMGCLFASVKVDDESGSQSYLTEEPVSLVGAVVI